MLEGTARVAAARGARQLCQLRLVRGNSGNVSLRLEGAFLITPAGRRLGETEPQDLILVPEAGEGWPPLASSETGMHRATYLARRGVGGVVHTHSPYATAAAGTIAGGPRGLQLARVEAVPAGSDRLAQAVARALAAGADAALLEDHGVVAVGATLEAAITVAELVEEWAQAAYLRAVLKRGETGP